MIKRLFEKWKYWSYPQNADFYHLLFEYDPSFFEKRPIDRLNDNIIEGLKVSLIEWLFDKLKYVSNPQNSDLCDLSFDCGKMLITRRWIYHINDWIVEILNNDSIVDVYTNLMQE